MGGSAFNAILHPNSFPRLPPAVYHAVKARLRPTLESLYQHVGVPREAPEKQSYGDVDFVVACPQVTSISPSGLVEGSTLGTVVPPEFVKEKLGARFFNPMEGYRTSNFALPVRLGEWADYGHGEEEEKARKEVETGEIFYQESGVDVNANEDREHWERVMFFNSYGDMGMILGLLGRNAGLRLGSKGLKYPDDRNPPIDLSESFPEILPFMGLSLDRWQAGFKAKTEVFEWISSSRFFNPAHFRVRGEGISKVKADRRMYAEFVEWVEEQKKTMLTSANVERPAFTSVTKDEALEYFNKADAYAALMHARSEREKLKKAWCGSNVNDWAGMNEYWKGVKVIMDAVRARLGGDERVLDLINEKGEEELKRLVVEVKEELFTVASDGDGGQKHVLKRLEAEGAPELAG